MPPNPVPVDGARRRSSCGNFSTSEHPNGVVDLFFAGAPQLLEWVFGSLQLSRILKYQRRMLPGKETNKLLSPPKISQHRHSSMAHYVIEGHLHALGLRAQGLVRSHPSAVQHVTFGLFRERGVEVGDFDRVPKNGISGSPTQARSQPTDGPKLCDGRWLCVRGAAEQSRNEAGRMARWRRENDALEARYREMQQANESVRRAAAPRIACEG